MINLKLKPDLVQCLDRFNFYSFSLLSNENLNNDERLSLFSKANTFVTSLFNNSKINFTENKSALHFVPRFYGDKDMSSKYPNIFSDLDTMFKTANYINSSKYSSIVIPLCYACARASSNNSCGILNFKPFLAYE